MGDIGEQQAYRSAPPLRSTILAPRRSGVDAAFGIHATGEANIPGPPPCGPRLTDYPPGEFWSSLVSGAGRMWIPALRNARRRTPPGPEGSNG